MVEPNRVATKWPGRLLSAGFVPVSRIFLRNYFRLTPHLTPFDAIFLINLLDYVWKDKIAYPSWARLAEDLGVTSDRVRQSLDELVEKGYVRFVPIESDRGRAYALDGLYAKLEQLIDSGEAWLGRPTPKSET